MSDALKFVAFDFRLLKETITKLFWGFIGFVIIITFFNSPPSGAALLLAICASSYVGGLFSLSEKNNIYKLYSSLPVKKNSIVLGRYLFSFVFVVFSEVLGIIISYAVLLITNETFSWATSSYFILGGLLFSAIFLGIQIPVLFKYEYAKVRTIMMVPFILFILAGAFLGRYLTTGANSNGFVVHLGDYVNQHMGLLWLVCMACVLLIFSVSCFISIQTFQSRKIV